MKYIYVITALIMLGSCNGTKTVEKIETNKIMNLDSMNVINHNETTSSEIERLTTKKIKITKVEFFDDDPEMSLSSGDEPSPLPEKAKKDRRVKSISTIEIDNQETEKEDTKHEMNRRDSTKVADHVDEQSRTEVLKKPESRNKISWIAIICIIAIGTFAFLCKKYRDD